MTKPFKYANIHMYRDYSYSNHHTGIVVGGDNASLWFGFIFPWLIIMANIFFFFTDILVLHIISIEKCLFVFLSNYPLEYASAFHSLC